MHCLPDKTICATYGLLSALQLALPGEEADFVVPVVEQVSTLLAYQRICARREQSVICWRLVS